MKIFYYLIGLLLVAVTYLIVPIIFCLCSSKLSKSKIITIVVINCVCVTLLYYPLYGFVLIALIAMVIFGVPWSFFAYWLMNKKCLRIDKPIVPNTIEKYTPKYKSTPIKVEEMSLSLIGETPKKYGNCNVYGSDIRLQTEEPKPNVQEIANKESDTVDIILRLKTDEEFFSAVKTIYELDKEKLSSLLHIIK